MPEKYLVYNWRVGKWRGNGDQFYTRNKWMARRFDSRESALEMCAKWERVERVTDSSFI